MERRRKRLLEGAARENVQRLQYHLARILRFNGRLPAQLPLMPEQLSTLLAMMSVCEALLGTQATE